MGGFKAGHRVGHVGARRDADAAHLCGQRVGDVVAIEVERGHHRVLGGAQQDLLQEGIGNAVLDDDFLARLGVGKLAPWAAVDQLGAKLLLRQGVGPVAEAAFGVLHDVALVHDGHAGLVVVNGVLDGLADQALGAFARDGLDADARGVGEADLGGAQFVLQKRDELLGLVGFGGEFNARVDVFRVLAEDDHVGLFRLFQRRWHALEVLHGAQAHVQIQLLTQGHVQRADAAAHGRGERAFDGHHVVAHGLQGFVGQPHIGAVDAGGLLAREHFHPLDLALAAVGLGHGSIHHLDHHGRDVAAHAIAFNERDDGLIGHVQRHVGVDGDLLPLGRNLDVLESGHGQGSP